jgi:hypothetical protein
MNCLNCGKKVKQTKGKRVKQYCNAECRQKHWQKKNREANPPARGPGRPPKFKTKILTSDGQKVEQPDPPLPQKEDEKVTFYTQEDSHPDLGSFVAPPEVFDAPKLNALSDEPKMWQEGAPTQPSGIIKSETKVAGMIFTDKDGRITKVISKPVFPLITDNDGKVVDVGEELMYPSDYNDLLRLAKSGVTNEAAFRKHVENTKLTPGQRGMIYSKLKK